MNKARSTFKVFTSEANFEFKAHGGSFTNRGNVDAVVAGSVVLAPGESFSVPVIDANTQYDQSFDIAFLEEGTKKVVVQLLTVLPSNESC